MINVLPRKCGVHARRSYRNDCRSPLSYHATYGQRLALQVQVTSLVPAASVIVIAPVVGSRNARRIMIATGSIVGIAAVPNMSAPPSIQLPRRLLLLTKAFVGNKHDQSRAVKSAFKYVS
jgi:hypothetical protein